MNEEREKHFEHSVVKCLLNILPFKEIVIESSLAVNPRKFKINTAPNIKKIKIHIWKMSLSFLFAASQLKA